MLNFPYFWGFFPRVGFVGVGARTAGYRRTQKDTSSTAHALRRASHTRRPFACSETPAATEADVAGGTTSPVPVQFKGAGTRVVSRAETQNREGQC